MTAPLRAGWAPWIATLALALAVHAPARADFLDNYKEGLKAAEAGDWATVRTQMAAAVAEQPESSPRLARKLYFRRYIPHYYLGRARFELGDCPGALAAWKTSEEQEVIRRFPEFEELAGFRATCQERAATRATKVRQAEEALRRGQEAQDLLNGLPTPDMRGFWDDGTDSLALRTARAAELLEEARKAFAGRGEPAESEALVRTGTLAREAAEAFRTIQEEAGSRLEEAVAARNSLAQTLEPLRREAQRSLAGIAFLKPYPSGLASSAARLEALLAASQSLGPATTAEDLRLLQKNLTETLSRVERQAQAPPKSLMSAAEAFFSGRYEDVLTELEGVDLRSRQAKDHGHLFLAAARFALYVSGGEKDAQLLEAVRQDVLACRAANERRQPEPRAFSPRFIEFFLAQEEAEEPVP